MLDISTESRLARATVPSWQLYGDDVVGWLNTRFRRNLDNTFLNGKRFGDIYVAWFTNEDAARIAMAWVDTDLTDLHVKSWGRRATLTGLMGRVL